MLAIQYDEKSIVLAFLKGSLMNRSALHMNNKHEILTQDYVKGIPWQCLKIIVTRFIWGLSKAHLACCGV